MAASRLPLVVVLGATGAGKSKLAIEIAKVFNGEIISADSMQIYKGLDIISNKVTEEEQHECPHHMISYLEASSRHNTVVDFRDKALPMIDNILERGRMPVVVGGTNYYIESLMWDFLVKPQTAGSPDAQAKEDNRLSTSPCPEPDTPTTNNSASPQSAENKKRKFGESNINPSAVAPITTTTIITDRHKDTINCNQTDVITSDQSAFASGPKTAIDKMLTSSHSDSSDVNVVVPQISFDLDRRQTTTTANSTNSPSVVKAPDSAEVSSPVANDAKLNEDLGGVPESETLLWLNSFTTPDLYNKLLQVDPDTALRHHPNNRRKLLRALQIFHESGSTLSSILAEQHGGQPAHQLKSGPLRYQDPCILWVKCQQPTLNERLDGRVDTMIERGLVQELEEFDTQARTLQDGGDGIADCSDPSSAQEFPHGIMQMIGFKEFKDFLQLSSEDRLTEEGQKLFQRGVNDLKTVTRRYARQQKRWIMNRFCSRPGPDVPPVYAVDTTDLTKWSDTLQKALNVVSACVKGEKPSQAPEPTLDRDNFRYERHVCDVCDGRVFLHQHEWQGHIKSKKHLHNVKQLKKNRAELSSILTNREKQLEARQGAGDSGSDGGDDVSEGGDDNENNMMGFFLTTES